MNNKEYNNILYKLKKDENLFNEFIKIIRPSNIIQLKRIQKYSKTFKNTNDIKAITYSIVIKQIYYIMKKKPYRFCNGVELPKLINKYYDLLLAKDKNKILNFTCTPMNNLYNYGKRDLLRTTIKWINAEKMAVKVIKNHHRLLNVDMLENLLSKIKNGMNNESLAEFRDSSELFVARHLQALDITTEDNKHTLVNSIAKKPAILNYFGHMSLNITLKDLKKLPPARRFDFLQYCFKPVFGWYNVHNKTWYPRTLTKEYIKKAGEHRLYKKLSIDKISRSDIKHLLFAVSIRKNEEVSAWYERYDAYLKKL
jgi:hypothetical protein